MRSFKLKLGKLHIQKASLLRIKDIFEDQRTNLGSDKDSGHQESEGSSVTP
jgi:hypothetical protein